MARTGSVKIVVDISDFRRKLADVRRALGSPFCRHPMQLGTCPQPLMLPDQDRCYYHRKIAAGLIQVR